MKIFEQYALLKMRIKDTEDQLKALEKEIIPIVEKMPEGKVQESFGTFSVTEHVTYEYSKKIQDMETKVKELKAIEKIKGVAKTHSKPKFVFMPAKFGVPQGAYDYKNINKKS